MNDKRRVAAKTSRAKRRAINDVSAVANTQQRAITPGVANVDNDPSNVFGRTQIAILFLDVDLHITSCTPGAMQLLTIDHSALGQHVADVTRDFLQNGLVEQAQTVLDELTSVGEEITLANGQIWRREIAPCLTNSQKVNGFAVTFLEITHLMTADVAKRRLAAIVESSDDAIIGKSLDGVIQSWNQGAERLFGYTAEEMIGQPITRLEPKHRKNEMTRLLERIRAGERVDHFETERVAKNGRLVYVSLTVSPIIDSNNQVVGASKVARDIGAKKRVEAALRASEQRYRALVQTQAEMLCRFRIDGTILFANEAYARAQNKSEGDLVGSNFWTYIPTHERAKVRKMLRRITPDAPEIQVENQISTSTGDRWMLWTNRGIEFDDDGRVVEAQSTGMDITERKLMEEKLRLAHERKNEFLATLGHELRNPLAPLSSGIDLLKQASSDPTVEKVRDMMDRQVHHLTRLVNDLVDISRISRGDIELRRLRVNCSEVVDAALELSSPLIEQREHKLVLKRPEGTVWINGDFERMTQAVSNLLNNAARYSEVGATITVSAGKAAGLAYIRVTDTGLGFAPDVAESLFDMFARVPQHKKYTGGGGLGVGLPLARQLVELHGGTIVAKSDGPGKGSTFEVRIPLAAEDIEAVVNVAGPDSDDRRSTLPAADTSSRRILVVDDNVDAAEAMSLLLEKHNHVVRIAHDGESAIKMVGDFEPQAVLLDIGLPGTDGYDVASAIRQMPIGQSIRLIALTGWGQAHDKRLAKKAGFDEHLTKPASMQRVLELIVDKHQH